jgi:sirohydrochlorin cobaltochelatase
MTNPKTVIVLAMHGVPPSDFPRLELAEFFMLHSRFEHAAASRDPAWTRYSELERKLRDWPRTKDNDPYYTASFELARELSIAAGCDVVVGFNEFCAPSLDDALDRAVGSGAQRVVVVTPMMTQGGEHSEKDIPGAVERARTRHPEVEFVYAWPFPVPDAARFLANQVSRATSRQTPGRA